MSIRTKFDELQDELDSPLPEQYKEFLFKFNGGTCRQEIIVLENNEEVYCDCLFGLGQDDSLDLLFWKKELDGDLPENCIVIGSDPCGALFILISLNGAWEVMLYDYSYFFSTSTDDMNTYKINKNLSGLIGLVEGKFNA